MNLIWVKLIGGGVLILAIGAGAAWWHHEIYQSGFDAEKSIRDTQDAINDKAAQDKYIALTAKAQQNERDLNSKIFDISNSLDIERQNHEATKSAYLNAARAGTLQLRVATIAPSENIKCTSPSNSATASQSGAEAGSVVVPQVADDILSVAAGTAELVRQYNALVDAYNAARATCNADIN
jgi:TolA-binding protein